MPIARIAKLAVIPLAMLLLIALGIAVALAGLDVRDGDDGPAIFCPCRHTL